MTTLAIPGRPTGVVHEAKASLTLHKSGLFIPQVQDAFEELIVRRDKSEWDEGKSRLAPMIVKTLAPLVAFAGVHMTQTERIELFRELLRGRYFIAGGAAAGDYLEQEVMEHFFKNTAIVASPASVDVHLYTSATSDANGTGTEVSGGSYAAENVVAAGWDAPGATGGATANSGDVDFGTASANWGTVSHVSIEMPSSANRLFHGALAASKTVNNGDSFKFATGDLDVAIA